MKHYKVMLLGFIAIMGLMTTTIPAVGTVLSVEGQTTAIPAGIILNVQDFGAVGDGVTDDSPAIQSALNFAFAKKQDLYFPTATYLIETTLIIPQYHDWTMSGIRINCGNSNFRMKNDTTLFTSGYDNNGTLITNVGTVYDSHYSGGIVLENFFVTRDSTLAALTKPVMRIQDWHQGCTIRNISSSISETILESINNYYTLFDNIRTLCVSDGARFIFSGNMNLNRFTRLQAADAAIGYKFDGPLTACQFTFNSVEGVGIGLQFNSTVYDVAIENNYIEGFGVAIEFNSYVMAATVQNNYVNFLNRSTSFLVDYEPLPANNVIIEDNNYFGAMPSSANIIKASALTYGTGLVIQRPKINSVLLEDLIVSNSIFAPTLDWQQKVDMPEMRANVVNKYAVGNYSGQYSGGHTVPHGYKWINNSNETLALQTKITPSSTQRIYVNIYVYDTTGGSQIIKGEFMGSTFYEYTATGISVTTKLSVSTVNGFIQINGTYSGTITETSGEVRLM